MKMLIKVVFGLTLVLGFQGNLFAQITYDLQFVEVVNDGANGGNFDVKVQIKANNGTFGMGLGNLVFTYNSVGLKYDELFTAHNFSGSPYQDITVTEPATGRVSINFELTGSPATTVQQTYMDVVTIEFTIQDELETSNLVWRLQSPNKTNVFTDAEALLNPGNLNGSDASLPVNLTSFAAAVEQSKVNIQWTTESEINNQGFEIYRALEEESDYELLASYATNSDLTGHGNSATRHDYSYLDESVEPEKTYWYKLADFDYSGVKTFHGPITAVTPKAVPTAFKLLPNYPNPFNPSTTIGFDIPNTTTELVDTKLVIYNSLGQVSKTLFQDKLIPGSYEVQWDGMTDFGNRAPSGIYFVVFKANDFFQTGKLVLVK